MHCARWMLALALGWALAACSESDKGTPEPTADQGGDTSADVQDAVPDTPTSDTPTPDTPTLDTPTDGPTPDGPTPDTPTPDTPEPDAGPPAVLCSLDGDQCQPDERCVPFGEAEALICAPRGTVPDNEPCGAGGADDCETGVCVPYDDNLSFCQTLCSGDVPCPEAYQSCFPWFGPAGAIAGICVGDDCTPPAEGCEAGERCTVMAGPVFACVPAGDVPPGGSCAVDECDVGAICVEDVCRPYCDNASDCAADDDHCVWPWQDLTTVGHCLPGCDPVTQTDCGADEGCYFMDPELGTTDCWPAGPLVEGEDCSSFAEMCVAGLDCVLQPDTDPYVYYCRAYCDDDHPCATGTCTTNHAVSAMRVCLP